MRKLISMRTWKSDQSWNFQTIINFDGCKLKVEIRRNAYDNQSFARVKRWDGDQWNIVCSRPITECRCQSISYVSKNITDVNFLKDADSLVDEAMAVIS
jgi:hypothetical protein